MTIKSKKRLGFFLIGVFFLLIFNATMLATLYSFEGSVSKEAAIYIFRSSLMLTGIVIIASTVFPWITKKFDL